MTAPTDSRETGLNRYASMLEKHALWVVLGSVVICLIAASGGRFIQFDDNVRYFFKSDNPQLLAAEEIEAVYTKDDNILFALSNETGAFDGATVAALEDLTRRAWTLPYATRVDSVTNFQHSHAQDDDLIVEDLIENAGELSPQELTSKRDIALAEPLLVGRLISKTGDVVAANVTLTLPGNKDNEQAPSVEAARELAQQIEARYPGIHVWLGGLAMLNHTFPEAAKGDLATLVPLMYLILLVALGWLLRSVWAVLATALVIALSTATAMGTAGWLGIKLSPPSTTAATIVMTLAVADCIHILVTVMGYMRGGVPKNVAVRRSLVTNFGAVLWTSVTTAVGFASMNFSAIRPLNDLGNITTMGVMAAWLLAITFLPALLLLLPLRENQAATSPGLRNVQFADWVVRNRRPLFWVPLALALGLAAFVSQNRGEDRFVKYFDESFEFRRDADSIMARLTGLYTLEFSLNAGETGAISDPEYLRMLDEFATWYRNQPGVVHVSSFSDTMKRLNRNMNGDDPSLYQVPTDKALAAQYLLFFEMSLPYGLDLNNMLNVKKSSTRFIVTMQDVSSVRMRELAEEGEHWLEGHASRAMQTRASSTSLMFAYASGNNISSMIPGTALALGLISLMLAVAFRSVRYGILSLIPNLLPTLAAFGIWGLTVGTINFGLAMVAAVSLGIIVDDTVHFLTKYLAARRRGDDAATAVRQVLSSVGWALIVTSVVLVLGFGVVAMSPFGINAGMGRLTAITITLALGYDLLFLPAMLLTVDGKRATQPRSTEFVQREKTAV